MSVDSQIISSQAIYDSWGILGLIALGCYEQLDLPAQHYKRFNIDTAAYPNINIYWGTPGGISWLRAASLYFYEEYGHLTIWHRTRPTWPIDGMRLDYADPLLYEKIQELITSTCTSGDVERDEPPHEPSQQPGTS